MTVTEALETRCSIRAFLSTPVEQEKIAAIFEKAARTPSWANSQPWEAFVATGETLEKIKQGYADCYKNSVPAAPEVPRPVSWPKECVSRREQLLSDMKRDCGDAAAQFGALNKTMFGAPAVIYLCMDKTLTEWSMYDVGAYSQSLMLAAAEEGLGTIPAMTLALYPEILRRELAIPDDLKITIGIALGYSDGQNGINRFKSARLLTEQTVHIAF